MKVTTKNVPALPTQGFVRLRQVLQVIPVGKTAWYKGMKSGLYPKPIKLGTKTVAWRVDDIRALIAKLSTGE